MLTIQLALRNLLQARRRTSLLGAAIGLVTVLLVGMLSWAHGIEDSLVREATTLSAGHVVLAGFTKTNPKEAAPIVSDKETLKKIVQENTPGLDYVIDRRRGWGKVVSDTESLQSGLTGIDVRQEARFFDSIQLAPESDYVEGGRAEAVGDPSQIADRHTCMIYAAQAKRLGVKVGDVLTIQTETAGGQTNTIDITLVAVLKDMGLLSSFALLMNYEDLNELYALGPDTTGAIWIYLHDIEKADDTLAHLRQVFLDKGYQVMDHDPKPFWMKFDTVAGEDWVGQKLDLTVWQDEVSFITWVVTAFNAVTWFLVVILVAIVAVGIMNTMWNSVRERTAEIGTMRAIGMQRRRVVMLILTEAALLGLGATTAGALVGAALALGVDAAQVKVPIEAVQAILLSDRLHLAVEAGTLVQAIGFLTMFTALAAVWPAVRAGRLRPITAIQHVE
jgi:putative ABC transport system permease protein